MVNINKHTVREAANTDVSGEWTVKDRIDISSQAHGSTTVDIKAKRLGVYSDSKIYFRFDKKTTDTIDTQDDLILPAETLTFIRVPEGLKVQKADAIVFHCKQVSSAASKYCRIVEV